MIDWDDVRYFLAVARGGSVRAAAERLGVNHSTVLRRIGRLEERLATRLFDKRPSGYRATADGEEVLGLAERMEASSNQLETRIAGRDQSVRGLLRVTMAPTVATHLVMPALAGFARLHPEVEVEVLSLDEPVNLTNREAVRQGLGMTALPCFVGDPDPLLARVPGTGLRVHGTLWLLTQGETRKTRRLRLFTGFVADHLAGLAPLLAGRRPASG